MLTFKSYNLFIFISWLEIAKAITIILSMKYARFKCLEWNICFIFCIIYTNFNLRTLPKNNVWKCFLEVLFWLIYTQTNMLTGAENFNVLCKTKLVSFTKSKITLESNKIPMQTSRDSKCLLMSRNVFIYGTTITVASHKPPTCRAQQVKAHLSRWTPQRSLPSEQLTLETNL